MDTHIIIRTFPLPVTEVRLCGWIGEAAPGERLEYWRGHLALDRTPGSARLLEKDRLEVIRVVRRAFWAAERGLVHLVQQRHGPDNYSYLCIARPRPKDERRSLPEILAERPRA
jgi:hypothetical protein